jgi:hypothetical protein
MHSHPIALALAATFALTPAAASAQPRNDPAGPAQDMRSADTRDAANGRGTYNSPRVVVVKLPAAEPSSADGLDWADAGLGSLLGLGAIGLGGALLVVHRRRAAHGAPPVARV